jgi:hypothetical protein
MADETSVQRDVFRFRPDSDDQIALGKFQKTGKLFRLMGKAGVHGYNVGDSAV